MQSPAKRGAFRLCREGIAIADPVPLPLIVIPAQAGIQGFCSPVLDSGQSMAGMTP
jgi:hypothetical protein